jgi:hypothetical protein
MWPISIEPWAGTIDISVAMPTARSSPSTIAKNSGSGLAAWVSSHDRCSPSEANGP